MTGKAVSLADEEGRKYHAHFTSRAARDISIFWKKKRIKQRSLINIHGWTLSLNLIDKKVKTKNTWLLWNKFNVSNWSTLWVKLYENNLKGNKNYFELGGNSSYRGFELLRVIGGKSMIMVLFSAWFELARVRLIGSRLYVLTKIYQWDNITVYSV